MGSATFKGAQERRRLGGGSGARTRLLVADQENDVVEVYSYPQGNLLNLFSRRMQQPLGVAVFPPATD
jgi:hypothetical protein